MPADQGDVEPCGSCLFDIATLVCPSCEDAKKRYCVPCSLKHQSSAPSHQPMVEIKEYHKNPAKYSGGAAASSEPKGAASLTNKAASTSDLVLDATSGMSRLTFEGSQGVCRDFTNITRSNGGSRAVATGGHAKDFVSDAASPTLGASKKTTYDYIRGKQLTVDNTRFKPEDVCFLALKDGKEMIVESFGLKGVYTSISSDPMKTKLTDKEVSGICSSPDRHTLYCATGTCKSILIFGLEDGRLVLKDEVKVVDAHCLTGIQSFTPDSSVHEPPFSFGLILLDTKPRMTLHSPNASLVSEIPTQGRRSNGERAVVEPMRFAPAPCRTSVYVSDWGKNSVMKLDASSMDVQWKVDLGFRPLQIKAVDDNRVYVLHDEENKVSILSASDGSVEKQLRSAGVCRAVRQKPDGAIEFRYYQG